jgi:hypothetical protein
LEEPLRPLPLDASARKRFFKALPFYSGFSCGRAKTALIISLRRHRGSGAAFCRA